jgi:hypothetical protein
VTIESNFWTATPVSPTASPTPTASLPPTLTATQTLPPSATFTPSATADTSGPTATNANDSPDPIYTNGNAPDTATITVQVVDPAGVASVQLYYNRDGGKYVLWGAMALSSGNTYWTAFGPFPAIGTYNYRILATDALGNANCPPGGIAGCPGGSVTVIIP